MDGGEAGVRSLRQLYNELSEKMRDRTRPAAKTFVLEVVRPIPTRDIEARVRLAFRAAAPRRSPRITRLAHDPAVFEIRIRKLLLWLDTSDSRVWEIHSLGDSSDLNAIIERLITAEPALDVPWLPEHLLNELAGAGEFVGFGLLYSRAFFADDLIDAEYADSLSVNVRGSESPRALAQFRTQSMLERSSALSGVRIRNALSGPGAMLAGRISSSVSSNGRVSSRGDDFDRHRVVARHALAVYLEDADRIRDTMTVGELKTDGTGLRGPLVLDLHTTVEDLVIFAGRLFSGVDPFRLWGLLDRRADDLIVANAVDLRTGTAFTAELLPDEVRVYLPEGAPGAIVLRLLTLLQRHHDRRVRIA